MEKLDVHQTDQRYKDAVYRLKKDLPKKTSQSILNFLDASQIAKHRKKNPSDRKKVKKAGTRTRLKNLYLLKIAATHIKKFTNPSNKTVENFIRDLDDDVIVKQDGSKYSDQTKGNLKGTLIMFLNFTIQDKNKLDDLCGWIDTSYEEKSIPSLTQDQVDKVFNEARTLQQKLVFGFLVSSGLRVEEFLNLLDEDVQLVKAEIPYYRVTARSEHSKTKGRTFGIYWSPITDVITHWKRENRENNSQRFYNGTYNGIRKMLHKIGKRSINKSINPHLLRHTAATIDAGNGMDYFQLVHKYGWTIGSKQPQRYIDRSGINDRRTEATFINENVGELKQQLQQVSVERIKDKEQLQSYMKQMETIMNKIEKLENQNRKLVSSLKPKRR